MNLREIGLFHKHTLNEKKRHGLSGCFLQEGTGIEMAAFSIGCGW